MSKSKEHTHLRFQALVIASQLPENTTEALLVLDYARHMVMEFLDGSSAVSDNVQRVSGAIATQPPTPPRVRDRFTVQRSHAAGKPRRLPEARISPKVIFCCRDVIALRCNLIAI